MKADKHPQEEARLNALARYEILDTPSEAEFDDVVKVVSAFCETPVSLISLVESDRQWFKARFGTDLTETPIIQSICAHGILGEGVFEVSDTTKDHRTADNPLVAEDPNVRFYAGAPLATHDGHALGMLCVLDVKPRQLTEAQRELLRVMAKQVMNQLELRLTLRKEREARDALEDAFVRAQDALEQNDVLRKEADHRVKNSLQQVVAFLAIQERQSKNAEAKAALAEARGRVATVASVHEHLHRAPGIERVQVSEFLAGLSLAASENKPRGIRAIEVDADSFELGSEQILSLGLAANELISNAVKHAFPADREGTIKISFRRMNGDCVLAVRDDGVGLPAGFDSAKSRGLGMRVLSTLAQQLDGKITHESDATGSRFALHFPCEALS